MSDVTEEQHTGPAGTADDGQDSLAKATAAGPPIDWDDEDQTPDAPSPTVAANEADPLHSIYGSPPSGGREGD